MLETAFTRLVGCSLPLQLAGMGSINGPELTAAVSEAGALGQITFAGTQQKVAEARLNRIEELTSKPFGVNLIIPYFDPAILRMVVARARVVDFFWGEPDARLIDQVHAGGALASWQVGSVGEAIDAEKAGCDFIIAQGVEAGGHIRGRLSLLPGNRGIQASRGKDRCDGVLRRPIGRRRAACAAGRRDRGGAGWRRGDAPGASGHRPGRSVIFASAAW